MLKKFAATTSTAALAIGMLAAGAGVAAAQDEDEAPTGSMSSGSLGLDLGETAADLDLAAQALNGPVAVSPNEEDGPTVSFTNESEAAVSCIGFTMPYSTIEKNDIDPSAINLEDLGAALELIATIEAGGKVSVLGVNEDGEPVAYDSEGDNNVAGAAVGLVLGGAGVEVAPGEGTSWDSTNPTDEPAAAATICLPEGGEIADLEVNFGIDKQVVADQINDKIPGGSIAPVGPGSISGGSVELGAGALGSLAGGDDEGEEPAPEE